MGFFVCDNIAQFCAVIIVVGAFVRVSPGDVIAVAGAVVRVSPGAVIAVAGLVVSVSWMLFLTLNSLILG